MERGSGARETMQLSVTCTKGSIKMTRRMVRARLFGSLGTCIEDATKMMSDMAMARCFGLMAPVIKESGLKEFSMDLAEWSFQMDGSRKDISKTIFTRNQPLRRPS
jgi:hypothetical protein